MMRKVTVSQVVFPRLALFRNEFYRGRRFVVRGNVGIRNLERAFGDIESLRFFSPNANATLVLFSEPNFRGRFRVFRGSTNIGDLDDIIGGEEPESIISSNRRLTLAQIRAIRDTGRLPNGFRTI
ncbi:MULTISPECIES: hypothetical protein [Paenibacillus]|nr:MULTISPECIES: hypothetical protein [Paenibacillus]PCL90608.1 hypothetical protein CPZ30_22525 [Paenibacillus lautus]QOT10709.1 hypothetical protein JNUCC32_01350 [Paenibacillus sp. JNUCC-32]WFB57173.1 hypothetical protein P0X86_24855 [Paenibacillus sp. BR1-192]GIP04900.1 hypothetical protein J28TS4_33070 [Paenibacillus lautus]